MIYPIQRTIVGMIIALRIWKQLPKTGNFVRLSKRSPMTSYSCRFPIACNA